MEALLLIIGLLVVVWYFGLVRSARRLANAADTKSADLELAALKGFAAKYSQDDIKQAKETKDLLASF